MGHVDQEPGFDGFGDGCHAFEVDRARIGRAAGDQQRRAHLAGAGLDRVVVEQAARAVHAVVMGVEPAPREVGPGAVAKMPASRQVEAQDPVPGTQEGKEHRLVRLRARVRLHVGIGSAEEFLRAFDGEALDDVDKLAAPMEAVAGIALERLVADLVPERLAHGAAHHVLRSDELDPDALAARLAGERDANLRIGVGERPRDVNRGIAGGVNRACHRIVGRRGAPTVPGTGCGWRLASTRRIAAASAETDPRRGAFSRSWASGRFTGRSSPTIAGLRGRLAARTPGAAMCAGAEPSLRNRTPRHPDTAPHGASTGNDA